MRLVASLLLWAYKLLKFLELCGTRKLDRS